jgi:Tol biopolymer transport system component
VDRDSEPFAGSYHAHRRALLRGARALRAAVGILGLTTVALLGPATRALRDTSPAAPREFRLDVATPPTSEPSVITLSPDGDSIIFKATDAGVSRLWLRSLDRADAKPIPGTDNAAWPFWSPDGRSIGFFAGAKLLRLDLNGGAPIPLADAPAPAGGTWGADGTILFTPSVANVIRRVPASGGAVESVTTLTAGQTSHYAPWMLPDGRTFVFSVQGTAEAQGLYLATLGGGAPRRLVDAPRAASAFQPPNRLVFGDGGSLVMQQIDIQAGTLVGKPATVGPMVWAAGPTASSGGGGVGFSVASDGLIAFRSNSLRRRALVWRDRSGRDMGRVGGTDGSTLAYINLSPDDRLVAGARLWPGDPDLWVRDLTHDSETRLTFAPASDTIPVWAPDGQRIAFDSNRSGTYGIYLGSIQQPGADTRLFGTPYSTVLQDWSPDGRFMLYCETNPKTGRDLWSLDLTSDSHKTAPIAVTAAEETLAKFSPDGRWVAFQTNASGRFEIVVKRFRDGSVEGGTWQVSREGGVQPRWSRDGKELYFISPDGSLYASTVAAHGDTLEIRPPEKLFTTHINGGGGIGANASEYAVSRDGRFLINEVIEDNAVPVTVVLNSRF